MLFRRMFQTDEVETHSDGFDLSRRGRTDNEKKLIGPARKCSHKTKSIRNIKFFWGFLEGILEILDRRKHACFVVFSIHINST